MFSLILRFYDTEHGKIVIDSQDISKVSRHSLRQHIAYVGQTCSCSEARSGENIAFGKPGDQQRRNRGSRSCYVCAHDYPDLPARATTRRSASTASSCPAASVNGVAIARALMKNAPIILLDEATAALDSESELQVREAMERLCQGRTTLAIAHRLHTVSHADRIYVVEDGRATESGRHDELLRKGGRYAAFYRLQLKEQEAPPNRCGGCDDRLIPQTATGCYFSALFNAK